MPESFHLPESSPGPKPEGKTAEKYNDILRDLEISFAAVGMITQGEAGKKIFIDNFVKKLEHAKQIGIPAERLSKYCQQLKNCRIDIGDEKFLQN
jgi:hypothetical protein